MRVIIASTLLLSSMMIRLTNQIQHIFFFQQPLSILRAAPDNLVPGSRRKAFLKGLLVDRLRLYQGRNRVKHWDQTRNQLWDVQELMLCPRLLHLPPPVKSVQSAGMSVLPGRSSQASCFEGVSKLEELMLLGSFALLLSVRGSSRVKSYTMTKNFCVWLLFNLNKLQILFCLPSLSSFTKWMDSEKQINSAKEPMEHSATGNGMRGADDEEGNILGSKRWAKYRNHSYRRMCLGQTFK